jgi:DMSO/TMAO reductase YedYZ molybdopterin-dependent catalytic subunit
MTPVKPCLRPVPIADEADATPSAALLAPDMPFAAHFRRDHFPAPDLHPQAWSLDVGGAVRRPLRLDLASLATLGQRTERVTLECAGHRRTEHDPPVEGLAWATGAVGEARWTGAPLAALLELAEVLPGARAVVLEGADRGPFCGREGRFAFARALPLAKALAGESLLAWTVNDEPLPVRRGGPVRAIVPGWYATDSVKWLTQITVIDGEFEGPFEAEDYRLIAPGDDGPGERMTTLPVHALLVDPAPGAVCSAGLLELRGIAWGGHGGVARVDVRVDDGPWRPAELAPSRGPWARRFWRASRRVAPGARRISVRATDAAGAPQPEAVPANRYGFANNAVHRVRLEVTAS